MSPRRVNFGKVDPMSARVRRDRPRRRAFTLVEVIVVVTIIALLAAIVAPRVIGQLGGAKKRIAASEVKAIENAVNLYRAAGGEIGDDFDLEVLTLPPDPQSGIEEQLLEKEDLADPWGNAYLFQYPPEYNPDFDIVSAGPDGQLGTADDIHN